MNDLVYRLSHDLRAPLRGAASSTEWIVEGLGDEMPEDVADAVFSLRHCVTRMQSLLDGLLEVSRAGSADGTSTFDLAEQIEIAAEAIEGLDVEVRGHATCVGRSADFSRAFAPLLENVLHHSDGATRAFVDVSVQDGKAFILVKDEGPGVADPNRAFELYVTRFGASNPQHVGVGLTIARTAAEAHGGTVTFIAAPSPGTTVQMTWPCAPPGDPP